MPTRILSEKEILRRIRALYDKEKPLNISAVKRHQPKLIEAAFARKPFLGWKRALEKAGIEYSEIQEELTETVACEICGKELRMVTNHVTHGHKLTKQQYLTLYPDAPLLSDEYRKSHTKFGEQTVLPHWEPFWTPEYVLDRVYALHEHGIPMNSLSLRLADCSLENAIQDWKADVGTFSEILTRLGIKPESTVSSPDETPPVLQQNKVGKSKRYPTAAKVKTAIRKRKREKLPMNSTALQKGADANKALFMAACAFFGNWDQALKSAGLSPQRIRKYQQRFFSTDNILAAIREKSKQGEALNAAAINKSDGGLYIRAVKEFGSWDAALKAAGLNLEHVRKRVPKYKNIGEVMIEIMDRNRTGKPIHATAVRREDSSLYRRARILLGSWDNALKKSGFNPKEVRGG